MILAERQGSSSRSHSRRCAWPSARGTDIGRLGAVQEAARRAGRDPEEIRAAVDDPDVKAALAERRTKPPPQGVFRVPTVQVGPA